ncbi:MAG: hypothetical protein Q7S96_00575 [bacterium]|nr:hypothetical protein [bacterium]
MCTTMWMRYGGLAGQTTKPEVLPVRVDAPDAVASDGDSAERGDEQSGTHKRAPFLMNGECNSDWWWTRS